MTSDEQREKELRGDFAAGERTEPVSDDELVVGDFASGEEQPHGKRVPGDFAAGEEKPHGLQEPGSFADSEPAGDK